jgi:hypothetical protein
MAQTQAPQTPQTSATSTDKVTITGCLKAAPPSATDVPSPTGTTGTAGTATPPGASAVNPDAKFLLTDVAHPSSGATAAPGAESSTSSASTYRLIANPTALAPHVGKKLELTGTIDKSSPAPSAADPSIAFRVESGKVIADSCSQ